MSRIVGLEEHTATTDAFAAWRKHNPDLAEPVIRKTVSGNVAGPLLDLDVARTRDMDSAAVDQQGREQLVGA